MDIRKISIGPDYKSGAMHYIVGQEILGGNHEICLIKYDNDTESINVWIKTGDEVFLWKTFNSSMPMSIEYNINF
jgi:hypothetical protein